DSPGQRSCGLPARRVEGECQGGGSGPQRCRQTGVVVGPVRNHAARGDAPDSTSGQIVFVRCRAAVDGLSRQAAGAVPDEFQKAVRPADLYDTILSVVRVRELAFGRTTADHPTGGVVVEADAVAETG